MKSHRILLIAGVALAIASPAASAQSPRYGSWGVETNDMDPSVRPGDDFFEFAEGTWLKKHPIPADKIGAGRPGPAV
jgi:endothelin-converting enzyme/putative endopeptidase